MWIYLVVRTVDKHVICAYVTKEQAQQHLETFPRCELKACVVSLYGQGDLGFTTGS